MRTHGQAHIESFGPGQTVDSVDQLGSMVLMGIAAAGSAAAAILSAIL